MFPLIQIVIAELEGEGGGARAAHTMVTLASGLYILTGRSERTLLPNICKLVIR